MNVLKSFGFVVAATCILATAALQQAQAVTLYSVRTGDTPARIAREHNISLEHLRKANADLRKSSKLHPGQILIIPDQDEALIPEGSGGATYVIHNVAPAVAPAHPAVAPAHPAVAPAHPAAASAHPAAASAHPAAASAHPAAASAHPAAASAHPAVAVATPAPKPSAEPQVRTTASRDTEVVIEPAAPAPQQAAPITLAAHDNVVIVDNQIIRVPTYVKPAEDHVRRGALASRRGSIIASILSMARKFIGVPYVWGGTTASGFDCSGFVMRVFAINGIHLPRTADAQYYRGTPVKTPEPGDLVFFSTYLPGPSHVGIYLGGNMFIQACSSRGVTISSLTESFYHRTYIGARRYI
ncbi:MAG: C40 family peptidase [Candidatus Xenobia bacterium]